jgi:hypothetical protein
MFQKPKRVIGILEEGDMTVNEMPEDVQRIIKKYAVENPLIIKVVQKKKKEQSSYFSEFRTTARRIAKRIGLSTKPKSKWEYMLAYIKLTQSYMLGNITKDDLAILLRAKNDRRLLSILASFNFTIEVLDVADKLYYNEL